MACKPGDLAIVIHSECGNLGRIVSVVRPVPPPPDYGKDLLWWVCEGRDLYGHVRDKLTTGPQVAIPDKWLRPLPGDMKEDTTERERELVE